MPNSHVIRYVPAAAHVDITEFPPEIRAMLETVNTHIAANDSLKEILDFLFETFGDHSPTNRVALAFVQECGKRVVAYHAHADYNKLFLKPGFTQDIEDSSLENVIRSGRARIIDDLQVYLAVRPESNSTRLIVQEGIRSSMTCPLTVNGKHVGLLFRSSTQPYAYDDTQVRMWQAVAERISQAVSNAYQIEELSEANRVYTEMLGFVSHELKSPIASLVMDANLMLGGYLGELTEKQEVKIQRMVNKSKYLLNLVREYIDLARLEGGEMTPSLHREVRFEEDILTQAIDMLEPQRLEKNIELTVDCEADLLVECDPNLMLVVLINLLGNAYKYGDENGTVDVRIKRRSSRLEVTVHNTGPGFPADQRSKLFRRFSRLDTPELRKRKGTGIGLYSCWRIVTLHHGHIQARSNLGEWAEFSFSIPQPIPDDAPQVPLA
ncbi:MAG: GAF domain-containing sensor histidine kinase [Phycisphaerales bacterium]|nr:GAF domain-containing sensor histidine kinase [Phycisphaerales bacterium]